jgi:hypothetical protein
MDDEIPAPIPFPGSPTEPDDDRRDETPRERALPEHERDDARTIGGGVLTSGGTAIDRGTGTLGGQAQGPVAADDVDAEARDDGWVEPDDPDRAVPNPKTNG